MRRSRRPSEVMRRWQCGVCAWVVLGACGAVSASDLIPLRPAVESAEVLLYDGQETAFGTLTLGSFPSMCLSADGDAYTVVELDGSGSAVVRTPAASGGAELVIAAGGTTTTGEVVEAIGGFVLLPSDGPVVVSGLIRGPGESVGRRAVLRVDGPQSATVLLAEGNAAPAPLSGVITFVGRTYNAISETVFATTIEAGGSGGADTVGALLRVSITGEIDLVVTGESGGVEGVDQFPRVGPNDEIVYAVSPSPPGAAPTAGEIRTTVGDGTTTSVFGTGDAVNGVSVPSTVVRPIVSVTSGLPVYPDAYHLGFDGKVYAAARIRPDSFPGDEYSVLLRGDASAPFALLGYEAHPRIRAFRNGAVVMTGPPQNEIVFVNGEETRVLYDAATDNLPGFAPGSWAFPDGLLGMSHYDLRRDSIVGATLVVESMVADQYGVFTIDRAGDIDLLVRSGDTAVTPLGQREIRSVRLALVGIYKVDDVDGRVLVAAQFTDGSRAILRVLRVVTACPGDANLDDAVDFADLNAVLSIFGEEGAALPADLNGDGVVDSADLNLVLSGFGQDCD